MWFSPVVATSPAARQEREALTQMKAQGGTAAERAAPDCLSGDRAGSAKAHEPSPCGLAGAYKLVLSPRVRRQGDEQPGDAAIEGVDAPPDRDRQYDPYPEPFAHEAMLRVPRCARITV